jgi:hypothetical protein
MDVNFKGIIMKHLRNGIFILGLLFSLSTLGVAQTDPYPNRGKYGVNLNGVIDWSPEWSQVNILKPSRDWVLHGSGTITMDEEQYPIFNQADQWVETYMFRDDGGKYPAGVYVVTWEGAGKVTMDLFDVAKVLRREQGYLEVQVNNPTDAGLLLRIYPNNVNDQNDHVHNINVWMPGFDATKSSFHPLLTERLQPFSTIRFMDWQRTNGNTVTTWDDRARMDDAHYTTAAGMPIRKMVDLANQLNANPWFCIPHMADDDFIRHFATVVRDNLKPGLKAYVEYSNECWNGGFAQTQYCQNQGLSQHLSQNAFEAGMRFYSQQSVHVFSLWEQVFGGTDRVVRVMGGWFAVPDNTDTVLKWNNAYQHTDALAVGEYFGNIFGDPKTQDQVSTWTVDYLLDQCQKELDGSNLNLIRQQIAKTKPLGVSLVAYEGGQHLVGYYGAENNQALTALFTAANRSPRMYNLYKSLLSHWETEGGGVFVAFNNVCGYSKWGSWGLREYEYQPIETAHKYRAFVDLSTAGKGLPVDITSSLTASATVNTPFSYQISATCSPTSYNALSLPPGLILNRKTGVISGTPTLQGRFSIMIRATNVSATGSDILSLSVN